MIAPSTFAHFSTTFRWFSVLFWPFLKPFFGRFFPHFSLTLPRVFGPFGGLIRLYFRSPTLRKQLLR